jgi:hypothetical protein
MQFSKTQSSSYSILGTGGGVSAHGVETKKDNKIQSLTSIDLCNEYSTPYLHKQRANL